MNKFLLILVVLAVFSLFSTEANSKTKNFNSGVTIDQISDLAQNNKRLVIVVDQEGCGACEVAKEYIKTFDDKNTLYAFIPYDKLPAQLRVSNSTPTFILFKNKKVVGITIGVPNSAKELKKKINSYLGD